MRRSRLARNVRGLSSRLSFRPHFKRMPVIIARRWFDKINGNTYHAVRIFDGNELIAEQGMTYGYGEHYMQTAFELLIKKGYYKGLQRENGTYIEYNDFRDEVRERGLVTVTDVQRQRDLKDWY